MSVWIGDQEFFDKEYDEALAAAKRSLEELKRQTPIFEARMDRYIARLRAIAEGRPYPRWTYDPPRPRS